MDVWILTVGNKNKLHPNLKEIHVQATGTIVDCQIILDQLGASKLKNKKKSLISDTYVHKSY